MPHVPGSEPKTSRTAAIIKRNKRIYELRKKYGMSQTAIARRYGLTQPNISYIVRGFETKD